MPILKLKQQLAEANTTIAELTLQVNQSNAARAELQQGLYDLREELGHAVGLMTMGFSVGTVAYNVRLKCKCSDVNDNNDADNSNDGGDDDNQDKNND
eukprot:scaffold40670_cov52-Prasinocladus_malaysianus.AAC.1